MERTGWCWSSLGNCFLANTTPSARFKEAAQRFFLAQPPLLGWGGELLDASVLPQKKARGNLRALKISSRRIWCGYRGAVFVAFFLASNTIRRALFDLIGSTLSTALFLFRSAVVAFDARVVSTVVRTPGHIHPSAADMQACCHSGAVNDRHLALCYDFASYTLCIK